MCGPACGPTGEKMTKLTSHVENGGEDHLNPFQTRTRSDEAFKQRLLASRLAFLLALVVWVAPGTRAPAQEQTDGVKGVLIRLDARNRLSVAPFAQPSLKLEAGSRGLI